MIFIPYTPGDTELNGKVVVAVGASFSCNATESNRGGAGDSEEDDGIAGTDGKLWGQRLRCEGTNEQEDFILCFLSSICKVQGFRLTELHKPLCYFRVSSDAENHTNSRGLLQFFVSFIICMLVLICNGGWDTAQKDRAEPAIGRPHN